MAGLFKVLEIIGEGKTDLGGNGGVAPFQAEMPTDGVLPVLVHKLCGEPNELRVVRRKLATLQSGSLKRKVVFSKVQAYYNGSHGAVFVVDTEGDHPARKRAELIAGRDEKCPEFPMAVGIAHPCIETWLLVDATAIARAMRLAALPETPADPEGLPAPQKDRNNNPKTVLARCSGSADAVSSRDASRIASMIKDIKAIGTACPEGFQPFAKEVTERLAPLFEVIRSDSENDELAIEPEA